MQVRIYKPSKTAMQSGRAGSKKWLLEYEPTAARKTDPIMGWTSSSETVTQLKLWFETQEEAVAYAKSKGLQYSVDVETTRRMKPKAYTDNFANDRMLRWTH